MISSIQKDSQSWRALPWKKFQRHLFGLQKRVLKAKMAGNTKKLRSLQKLILRSKAARHLAVKSVTQCNTGKKILGKDDFSSLSEKARFKLVYRLYTESSDWRHSRLKSISITKKDGSIRTLKTPTIADRAWQFLAKSVVEPAHEGTFHERNYGFRPERCIHDAQKFLFQNLNSKSLGESKRVFELDIEKCFNRISHKAIMQRVDAPLSVKLGIFRCLKAGLNSGFPSEGTPRDGLISPLLSNIVFNGIEGLHQSAKYADDIIYILKSIDDVIELRNRITKFLAVRGLIISSSKTKLTSTKGGFDFLGWCFGSQSNGKIRGIPSDENFRNFRNKVKAIINNPILNIESRVSNATAVVREWKKYHKHCRMEGKYNLWAIIKRACKVFNTKKRNRYETIRLANIAFPSVPSSENGFINIRGALLMEI
jgi:RNA-directed DNA polymerase